MYGYSRASLVTAVQFRLNDPRAGTAEARWSADQIDSAISEAVKLTEPLGYDTYLDQTYPRTTLTDPDGASVTLGDLQVLDVRRVECFTGGKLSVLPAGTWSFNRSYDPFLQLTHTPATGEIIRAHVRRQYDPAATTLLVDQAMLIEYTIAVLYEQYVVYGMQSTTQEDTLRAQSHRMAGDTRKLILMQQQYPLPVPSPAPGGQTPAARGN